ncbi:ADP-ribosyl cyclase/cyclic ADP-ribose hydrolase 1 [Austrofundulus limnaeus]|uniref:ADP-ribosyl cyclase/cyclic ADP-ribose hydrolase n=1 Tax=Austrofundulus limnaeus TaxID=52670 RepID=A0A2I4AZ72_AUSLI|nr:PREDICTED: ADP-ribosyl cyclase/cyclic ADP-ribose hydrolase 1-like [Austrofundulus limnaeus]
MEPEQAGGPARRRRRCWIVTVIVVLVLICILALGLGLSQRQANTGNDFKSTFLSRCQQFQGSNCQRAWDAFQQAYVNRDPCNVPVDAYDPFITAVTLKPQCNRMMFWSKTKEVVHDFNEKKNCFQTLEDTFLGSVLDKLTWCGKDGSFETFTTGCPAWNECDNPVRSFWQRASAAFADAACGNVTVMLNGSIATPFDPSSIFASIEVNKLKSTQVNTLNVVLTNCANPSLQELKTKLAEGINYNCKEVPVTQIQECGSDQEKACGACW